MGPASSERISPGRTSWRPTSAGADLVEANLEEADLASTNLREADFAGANLAFANLARADLKFAILIETNLTDADLTGCRVYGISAWDLKLKGAKQRDLVITKPGQPEITVDNLEVAQFIYMARDRASVVLPAPPFWAISAIVFMSRSILAYKQTLRVLD